MISGFVVTPLILRIFAYQSVVSERFLNLKLFYMRRFYRLAPALAVALAISALSIFLMGPIGDHQRFAKQGISTLFLVGNIGAYKYQGNYFSPNPNPLVHTWSLSVEEQIYLILPMLLLILIRKKVDYKKTTTVVLCFVAAVSFLLYIFPSIMRPLYSLAGIEFASQFSFYSPLNRIWQFTLGGLCFIIMDNPQNNTKIISKTGNLLLVIATGLILFSQISLGLRYVSIIVSLLAIATIACKSLEVLPEFFIEKLEWVGDRSYSIYLIHMPLLYLAKYSRVMQIGNDANRTFQVFIAIIFSVLFGALNYSMIEERYRKKHTKILGSFKENLVALIITLVIPLLIFAFLNHGSSNHYWGLVENIQKPQYAGDLDSNCDRDSEIGPPCIYYVPGAKRTVLLLGDSHAGHISQAIVDASKISGWNAIVWTHSGCHVQFQQSIQNQVNDNCAIANDNLRKWVLENRPDLIVISQFVHFESSQNDLRNALIFLKSISQRLLLIENSPVFPDAEDFMVSRPILSSSYTPPKEFPQFLMQTRDRKASDSLAKWARSEGIFTMNFDSLFCKHGVCSRYSDGGWLYRDGDHFSVAGASLTTPKLIEFLNRF